MQFGNINIPNLSDIKKQSKEQPSLTKMTSPASSQISVSYESGQIMESEMLIGCYGLLLLSVYDVSVMMMMMMRNDEAGERSCSDIAVQPHSPQIEVQPMKSGY